MPRNKYKEDKYLCVKQFRKLAQNQIEKNKEIQEKLEDEKKEIQNLKYSISKKNDVMEREIENIKKDYKKKLD